ncbi:PHP domain-containing protein, partial [Bartonella sp. AA2SXKL]
MSEDKSKIRDEKQPFPHFIHLRVHSAYSLLEGALKIPQIIQHAISDHTPAVAITDTNNLFGALEFSQYCFSYGIQPIIGC